MRARRLTPTERARIPEFIEKWIAIGLSSTPVDHLQAERALCQLYVSAGLAEPQIVWVPCNDGDVERDRLYHDPGEGAGGESPR